MKISAEEHYLTKWIKVQTLILKVNKQEDLGKVGSNSVVTIFLLRGAELMSNITDGQNEANFYFMKLTK